MTTSPSHFIWYELMTSDADAAAKFYGHVVGWTAEDAGAPGVDYRRWSIGGEGVGGLMTLPAEAARGGMRPAWLGYVNVADVDAAVAALHAAGGAVHRPAWDVPGVGRMAMVSDPQGAAFYVMTPIGAGPSPAFAPKRPGHGGWHELHTSDWEAAIGFYGARFGWGRSDTFDMGPMGTYQLFNAGGEAIGGMMNSPTFPQPAWLYYFNVEDIEAARTRVETAGGAVINGPHQVPTGDWMIQASDPQGAMFALLGPKTAGGAA